MNLPEEFWSARPLFEHIRQAAWSRLIGADGVLGACLARASFMLDYRIILPPVVARYGSLNLMAGLVAQSGDGKGGSLDVAEELFGPSRNPVGYRTTEATAGSGEGVCRAFHELLPADDGKKGSTEYRQVYNAVFIRVDEGEVLGQLGSRSGSTLWSIWRSGWSGEKLGFTNAGRERRIPLLQPHRYRLSAVIGIQPELAGAILADSAGGTPQRFLWFDICDPCLPERRVPWPGPIDWDPPKWNKPEEATSRVFGYLHRQFVVDATVVAELEQARGDKVRKKTPAGVDSHCGLNSHRGLNQLKVGGILAALDGRLDINREDWDLASMVLDTSDAVREATQATINVGHQQRERQQIEFAGRRASAEETGRRGAHAAVDRVASVIERAVRRRADKGMTKRDVEAALASPDRGLLDAAIEVVLARGSVSEDAGRFWAQADRGES